LLICIPASVEISFEHEKAHQRHSPAGRVFLISGRLSQAMAIRRHGCPMMMVMAVMAEALHLLPNYGQTPFCVKLYLLRFTQGFASTSDTLRDARFPKTTYFAAAAGS
jgi:hypothetical protein